MKRKSLFCILGVLLFTAASVSVSVNLYGNGTTAALKLANIEALAVGEGGGITMEFCFKAGSLGGTKFQCSERTTVSMDPGVPMGPIDPCSGSIEPSFLTRIGYCYVAI